MTTDELTELALRAGSGDDLAMDELLPIVMSKAKIIARKQLSYANYEDVEDLAQDILYEFLKSLPSFVAKSNFNTWLSKVGRNIAIDNYRKRIRRPELVYDSDSYFYYKYEPDCDTALYCEQLLTLCTEKQRPIMALISQGYSYGDIAEEMDVTYESVIRRYYRGIKRIQERLQNGYSTNTK